MPRNKASDSEEAKSAQQERAQVWSVYFRQLVREWQYADPKGDRVLLSKSDISRLVKVSDVTISQWWESKAFPSRHNCELVSVAFGIPYAGTLEAAGYIPVQDDGYNAINSVMQTVEKDAALDAAERKRLVDALVTTLTPDWVQSHPDWVELVRVVLNQKLPLLQKAERIANLVELSQQS